MRLTPVFAALLLCILKVQPAASRGRDAFPKVPLITRSLILPTRLRKCSDAILQALSTTRSLILLTRWRSLNDEVNLISSALVQKRNRIGNHVTV
ncbi:hypothetical protein C8J57DRAFT_1314917 [Mycena rebaudengoi]|nr:hypothetical protein C8J57DRAFT_1314917 [Mycena rebaudengoi]